MGADVLGGNIVGPFCINYNLNGDRYLDLLQDNVDAVTAEILEQDDSLMEDAAPAPFASRVGKYLNNRFLDRWLGRGGPMERPPRSPDLTPYELNCTNLRCSGVGTFTTTPLCYKLFKF